MKSLFLFRLSWALAVLLLSACSSRESLPTLMVKRLDWMDEVAMAKSVSKQPIHDPKREAELLSAMTQRGVAAGVPAARVRSFFTGQMQAAKVVQEEWLRKHPTAVTGKVPDLKGTVRPALDEISAQMIAALAQSRTAAESAALIAEARERLLRTGYSEAATRAALEGLRGGLHE